MTPENFCYWLQGYFEITGTQMVRPEQVKIIKEHLALVFTKKTPVYSFGGGMIGVGPVIRPDVQWTNPNMTASVPCPINLGETRYCGGEPLLQSNDIPSLAPASLPSNVAVALKADPVTYSPDLVKYCTPCISC